METASFCGQCGTGIPLGNKFCTGCGTPSGIHQAVTPEMLASLATSSASDTVSSSTTGTIPAASPASVLNDATATVREPASVAGAVPAAAVPVSTSTHEAATAEVPPVPVPPTDVPPTGPPPA